MKISGRGNIAMQQLMAMRASKQGAANVKAQKNPPSSNTGAGNGGGDCDSDAGSGGAETSAAQSGEQAAGINYAKLDAAVKAGVVRPAAASRNREEFGGKGDENGRNVSARQPDQEAKNAAVSNVKQPADAGTPPPQAGRSSGTAYTGSAKTVDRQPAYAKGELVDLSA